MSATAVQTAIERFAEIRAEQFQLLAEADSLPAGSREQEQCKARFDAHQEEK